MEWKSQENDPGEEGTDFLHGDQRIHYIFVKLHQALQGQTPAQVAGICFTQRNKSMERLRQAVVRDAQNA